LFEHFNQKKSTFELLTNTYNTMEINFLALLTAAFSTLVVGFIWYNPRVFGTIWMTESGMTEEKMKSGNMALTLLVSFIYAFFIAFVMRFLVVHQTGALGMVGGDTSIAKPSYDAFMTDYGTAFRTFKHGALHGFMAGLLFISPAIAINGLFERKSWRYMTIHAG